MGTTRPRIVIVGGGFVGLFSARRLQRRLREEAELVFVTPRNFMTYQPFLAEAAAGSLEPCHVVVALRRMLPPAGRSWAHALARALWVHTDNEAPQRRSSG